MCSDSETKPDSRTANLHKVKLLHSEKSCVRCRVLSCHVFGCMVKHQVLEDTLARFCCKHDVEICSVSRVARGVGFNEWLLVVGYDHL